MSTILALDLSLTATGWATDGPHSGTITTTPKQPLTERLANIAWTIAAKASDSDPDTIIVEDLPANSRDKGSSAHLGMVHGAVRVTLANQAQRLLTVPPATLKKFATGRGNATKPDMRMALYQRLHLDIRDDNQVDAIWLWALGHHLTGDPVVDLPKTHTDCLAKLKTSP